MKIYNEPLPTVKDLLDCGDFLAILLEEFGELKVLFISQYDPIDANGTLDAKRIPLNRVRTVPGLVRITCAAGKCYGVDSDGEIWEMFDGESYGKSDIKHPKPVKIKTDRNFNNSTVDWCMFDDNNICIKSQNNTSQLVDFTPVGRDNLTERSTLHETNYILKKKSTLINQTLGQLRFDIHSMYGKTEAFYAIIKTKPCQIPTVIDVPSSGELSFVPNFEPIFCQEEIDASLKAINKQARGIKYINEGYYADLKPEGPLSACMGALIQAQKFWMEFIMKNELMPKLGSAEQNLFIKFTDNLICQPFKTNFL